MTDYHNWSSPKVFSDRIKELIEFMNVPDVDFLEAAIMDRHSDIGWKLNE